MKFKPTDTVIYYTRRYNALKAEEYTLVLNKVWTEHTFMKPPIQLFQGTVVGLGKNTEYGTLNKFQSVVDDFSKIEFKIDPNQLLKDILHA